MTVRKQTNERTSNPETNHGASRLLSERSRVHTGAARSRPRPPGSCHEKRGGIREGAPATDSQGDTHGSRLLVFIASIICENSLHQGSLSTASYRMARARRAARDTGDRAVRSSVTRVGGPTRPATPRRASWRRPCGLSEWLAVGPSAHCRSVRAPPPDL